MAAGSTRAAGLALLAGATPEGGPRLVGLTGPAGGRTVPALDGLRLARAPDADVALLDPCASRAGIQLVRAGATVRVLDLGRRRARVNGRRVPRGGRALRPGDTLELGRSSWRFEDGPGPPTRDRAPPGRTPRAAGRRAARAALGAALCACALAAAAAAGWP